MMCVNWKHWRLEMASSRTSTDRRHHKHSKHKHRHKHGHHHHRHHGKHKKKGRDREKGKEKRKDEVPELNVDERELQTALEKLEEAMLEVRKMNTLYSLGCQTLHMLASRPMQIMLA